MIPRRVAQVSGISNHNPDGSRMHKGSTCPEAIETASWCWVIVFSCDFGK